MMWRQGVTEAKCSFKRIIFLGVKAQWKGMLCYFLDVYSPCNLA